MTSYDTYIFIICLLVFVALTALFITLLAIILKLLVKVYRNGLEDNSIRREFEEQRDKPPRTDWFSRIFSIAICTVFLLAFAFSAYVRIIEDDFTKRVPTLRVVLSDSMSFKNRENTYLTTHALDDQLYMHDLILTHALPPEEALEKYDIVVYESDNGSMIIHRIVDIEEPNEKHPDERYFLLQGDAVKNPDVFPVRYEQMRAIYEGQRIPFVGSFITFLQSPAGWLCILLMLLSVILGPYVEKRLEQERQARLLAMGLIGKQDEPTPPPAPAETPDETVAELILPEVVADVINTAHRVRFSQKQDIRTFQMRLHMSSDEVKRRYAMIDSYLYAIDSIRVNYSAKYQTFRVGTTDIAKMTVKSNTISVYLNLDTAPYRDSGLRFEDMSHTASFSAFPMLIRVTDDAQVEAVHGLIDDLTRNARRAKKGG